MPPDLIVHADWGTNPSKRVVAIGRLNPDGSYCVDVTRQVGRVGSPRERLGIPGGQHGKVLLGFDFPIGLPAAYAERAGIRRFRDALEQFGTRDWSQFYEVCSQPSEITLRRPFFPHSCPQKGMCRREHLTSALDISWADLHRRCEVKTADRVSASPLFWTLGGKQVGKAAICGWRDFVKPLLSEGDHIGLWPFDGPLDQLLTTRSCVIVETYPAEIYGHLGLVFPGGNGGGKTSQHARRAIASRLLAAAAELDARLSDAARGEVLDGFGAARDGEDRFDALVGLLGMVRHVVAGGVEPDAATVVSVEGWMLGQEPLPDSCP